MNEQGQVEAQEQLVKAQEEERRRMAAQQGARKAVAYMPHFDGKMEPWRCFEDRFKLWMEMNLEGDIPQDFRKRALLYAMKGNEAERAFIYKEGSTQWTSLPTSLR